MPESRYNPDNQDLARKTSDLEEILTSARDALANFITSLPAHEQIYIVQEAILPFHKNLEALKAYCAALSIGNGQDTEHNENTDANGLGGAARENPEDQEHNILNPGGDNLAPSPQNSPRNSLTSSKSLKIDGKSYQVRKQRINRLLQDIEENVLQNHSEHLEKQAALLSTILIKWILDASSPLLIMNQTS